NLKEYTNMTNSFTLFSGFSRERWAVTLPLFYSYYSLQGEKSLSFLNDISWWNVTRYMEHYGGNPTLRFLLRPNIIAEMSVGVSKKRYFKTLLHPRPIVDEEVRDADIISFSFGFAGSFKEGKSIVAVRYTFGKEHTKGRNWSIEQENRFSLSVSYPLDELIRVPLKLQLSSDLSFPKYKYPHSAFETKRRDDIYNLTGGLIYNLAKGVDLTAQYTYVRSKSNIAIYDYKREITALGFEYKF
ncbi:MAG: outer membrane beta-barrel protein, partial [Deltaproteobacteria bacterium]|nr:outer membrane beta-barrel protein [Deltaproteobacteria bacterium]